MKVFFALCTWGLGHAARDTPLIRRLLSDGHEVTVCTEGRSLLFLQKEFADEQNCSLVEFPDYPHPYTKRGFSVVRLMLILPGICWHVRREQRFLRRLQKDKNFDIIISDCRYGFHIKGKSSFFISHQLRYMVPFRVQFVERMTEVFNHVLTRNFDKIIVHDHEDAECNLTGDLSHNLSHIPKDKVAYIGPLSNIKKEFVKEDIDYLIMMSGPEASRKPVEDKILSQLHSLQGKIVIALGKPEENVVERRGNVEIHSFIPNNKLGKLMNRARFVVNGCGQTAMMELVFLGKKSLHLPTPGQTEQEYLSRYHNKKKTFYSVWPDNLDLAEDIKVARGYDSSPCRFDVEESVDNFMRILSQNLNISDIDSRIAPLK